MTKAQAESYLKGLVNRSKLGPEFRDILEQLAVPAMMILLYKDNGFIGKDDLGDSENEN